MPSVGKDHVRHWIRANVFEPVFTEQTQLVVQHQRIGLDQRVACGAGIDQVSGQKQLFRRGTSASNRARVQHQDIVPGLR